MKLSSRFKAATALYDFHFVRMPKDYERNLRFIISHLKALDLSYFTEKLSLLQARLDGDAGLSLIKQLYDDVGYDAGDDRSVSGMLLNLPPEGFQRSTLQRIDVVIRIAKALQKARFIMSGLSGDHRHYAR